MLLLTQTQIISSLPIARIVTASMLFAFGKIWNFIALESVLFENLYSIFVQTCSCFFWRQDNSSLSNIFFKRRASFHCKFVERNMWKCGVFLQSRPQLVRPLFLPLKKFDYMNIQRTIEMICYIELTFFHQWFSWKKISDASKKYAFRKAVLLSKLQITEYRYLKCKPLVWSTKHEINGEWA